MPASMVHLLCARKVAASADVLFYIGNIAPDAVYERAQKDCGHLRSAADRARALGALANRTDPENPLDEGALLHLYLDYRWDLGPLYAYAQADGTADGWFKPYRAETAKSGAWMFHHADWAEGLWREMIACPSRRYGASAFASEAAIRAFLERNYEWHRQTRIGPSEAFPPEFIDAFTGAVAGEYPRWRRENPWTRHEARETGSRTAGGDGDTP